MATPALVGGTGLAVDTAQWYMWKRELQYAVDQAALAGAWARTKSGTEQTYQTRALQEYNANLSKTATFASTPTVSLANWASGANNSVVVSATASNTLPFSSFFKSGATTVSVYAQASFGAGHTFTSCLIAVDEDDDGAINIGGNSVLTAGCGMAALSTSDIAITISGNPQIDAGWVLAAGGIDDWFDTHTDDEIHEYLDGLYDPFANLSPPNPAESQTTRTYSCTPGSTTTTATKTERVVTTYSYKRGANANGATAYTYAGAKANSDVTSGPSPYSAVPNGTTNGTTTVGPNTTTTQVAGSGSGKIFEEKTVTTTTTYADVVSTTTDTQASLIPGTYQDIKASCKTVFSTGVYIIDGGGLEITGQYEVTGASVMFVLRNGAYLKITGGSNINLTAITAADLIARGVTATEANKLAGMLVFEERTGQSTLKNNINGNTSTVLNGTIYLPKSNIDFAGTASVTSQCLMIAAATINITGTANMTTFCPAGSTEDTVVATTESKVRLVA